jgi:hypothetical protein
MKKLYILLVLLCSSSLKADWIHHIMNRTNSPVVIKTLNGVGEKDYYILGPQTGWDINFFGACIQGVVVIVPNKWKSKLGPKAENVKEVGDAIHFPVQSNRCTWKELVIDYDEKSMRNGSYFRIKETSHDLSGFDYSAFRFAPRPPQSYQDF